MSDAPLVLPTLSGRHVQLRAWRDTDVALVQEASHDALIPLVTTVPRTSDEGAALAFIRRQHQRLESGAGYAFAIADLDDCTVGHIGLFPVGSTRASIGYWIGASQRRRGYAADALATLTSWASTLERLDRLELYVEPTNEGSCRVAESAGYQREGLLKAWQRIDGRPRDMFMYAQLTAHARAGAGRS
ncbi:GNAT family N-acetyltransferase [Microbacterium sp. K2]|uniref:GNAT family N-acetyltransferase n=1 Tax=Microbacterium sp. K2 TaxID=3391827 RepID=UPI003EDAE8E2